MKARRSTQPVANHGHLVSHLVRQLRADHLVARTVDRLAFSPSTIKRFIEKVFRKDQRYSRAIVLGVFQDMFGQVTTSELQRVYNAGMDEVQRWQDYADGVVEKYEISFPGRGKDKLVSISGGDPDNGGITKAEAEQDKRRYLEATSKYSSTQALMSLVWQLNQKR